MDITFEEELEKEIMGTGSRNVSFKCDQCDQIYYEGENVESREVYFGPSRPSKPVFAEGTTPKMEENIIGCQNCQELALENMTTLGMKADELQAIISALKGHTKFKLKTNRGVLKPDRSVLTEHGKRKQVQKFGVDSNKVGAMIKVEPKEEKRSPDAVICEFCQESISSE